MDVASFTIDHDKLLRGIYVSRKDNVGDGMVTTFDIRMKEPNKPPFMEIEAIHTLEHLMAVYLRSEESGWADKVVYIGPMGCRTGMYLILKGDLASEDILPLIKNAYIYVQKFSGKVPATTSKECGNYLEHDLEGAKLEAEMFYNQVLLNMSDENMRYPK